MGKKTIWSVILVLVTTCSIFFAKTGLVSSNAEETPVVAADVVDKSITPSPTIPDVCVPYLATAVTYTPTSVPPTATPTVVVPTSTPTTIPPTATFTPTPIATVTAYSFVRQPGAYKFTTNFAHPAEGCNWQGYTGQVFDENGVPLLGYIVKVSGTYGGNSVSLLGITGAASGDPYGPGGYEIVFGNKIIEALHTMTIQLFAPNGVAVSDQYFIDTSSHCTENLGVFNFVTK